MWLANIWTGPPRLFGFGSNQDFEDSSRVIAFASAGGLGLPDRDYYVKDEPKMREIRERYVAHMARMFELLGDDAETAAAEAQTVMNIETALAKASLTQVEKRDPYKLFHKMTLAQLKAADALVRLGPVPGRNRRAKLGDSM